MVEEILRAAFGLYAKESGTIVVAEVVATLAKALKDMVSDEAVWQRIVQEGDVNGDGKIDFTEFK